MTNRNRDYIHGYTTTEQERLIQQAQYWRNDLILRELNYQSGDKLLEIGCGAGAVLGILGNLLSEAGFNNVENKALPFHYYSSKNRQKLQEFIAYVDSWLAPTVPLITEKLGKDKAKLIAGLEWFRSISNRDDSAATVVVYRASATR